MAEDGEVRVKITGDAEPIKKELSETSNVISNELVAAINRLSAQLTSAAEQLQMLNEKSQNALKPISNEAPQTAQAVEKVEQALTGTATSATSAQKNLDTLSTGLKKAENESDKLGKTTEDLGEETEKLSEKSGKAKQNVEYLGDSAKKSENKFKSLGTVLKSLGVAAAAAAVGKAAVSLGKAIVSSYADYEQLVGGVDTLFKNSSETVQQYAANAYKTAGMSANEYMKTVTGFSASLISSLGGDTQKAAEYADMAVTDMADNANKMGTDIESIQNAYQGFAKQNYTINLMSAA